MMLGSPGDGAPPPQQPPPQRHQNDGTEMGDPATFHHVALQIPVVDEPVRKSDWCMAVDEEIPPAYRKHPSFYYCLAWCTKTLMKFFFVVAVVTLSYVFIQNFATTKMTALQMLVFGALLGVFFIMALAVCWPDAC